MSKRYSLNFFDGNKIFKVVIYSALSAGLVSLINIIPDVDVPDRYIWIVPIVNILLVSLKKFFTKTEE